MQETPVRSLGWEDPLEQGKGYPLQYSGLENSMDSPWGRKDLDRTEPLALSLSSCGAQALGRLGFSSCSSWALERRLHSRGTQAQLLCSMWGLPREDLLRDRTCVSCTGDGFFFFFFFLPLTHQGSPGAVLYLQKNYKEYREFPCIPHLVFAITILH